MPSRAALVRHPLAIAGAVITTVTAAVFLALAAAVMMGMFENPYAGLVVFIALPAIFMLGLLLIPAGMWLQRRKLRLHPDADQDWPVLDFRSLKVRRTALVIAALTVVNLMILLLAGYGTLHSMESPGFCGQTCHLPMHPQFTAWQAATHSRVDLRPVPHRRRRAGAGALQAGGVRMMYHMVANKIPKPIPSVADLRPALEICGNCHAPDRGFGERIRVIRDYADDEANSETATILQMHVGGPGQPTASGRAIHWHADPRIDITFIATDPERQTIPFVKVTDAEGKVREFVDRGHDTGAARARRAAQDGLCRLPQRRGSPDCLDRGARRRRRPGRRQDQPHVAVRPAGRDPAAESGLSRSGRGREGDRGGIEGVLCAARQRRRRRATSIRRSTRCGRCSATTCFPR